MLVAYLVVAGLILVLSTLFLLLESVGDLWLKEDSRNVLKWWGISILWPLAVVVVVIGGPVKLVLHAFGKDDE